MRGIRSNCSSKATCARQLKGDSQSARQPAHRPHPRAKGDRLDRARALAQCKTKQPRFLDTPRGVKSVSPELKDDKIKEKVPAAMRTSCSVSVAKRLGPYHNTEFHVSYSVSRGMMLAPSIFIWPRISRAHIRHIHIAMQISLRAGEDIMPLTSNLSVV